MAHEIESIFTVGQAPWHNLGVILKDPPSIGDALRHAGLDWRVRLAPLCLQEDARPIEHQATIRESDNKILGIVGPSYVPLQNTDAFGWFQPFVESKTVALEAAGALRGGKRVWILARVADAIREIVPGDPITQFILLAHAHDGTLAIRVGFTTVRVVCQNTLSAALSNTEASKLLRIRHSSRALLALNEVREIINLAKSEFVATAERLTWLAQHDCDEVTLRRYIREVFAPGQSDDVNALKQTVARVVPLFEAGRGAELSRGTMWGAYNAVTEYVTHARGRSADARVEGQWFGEGAHLTDRALEVAMRFVA